MKRTSSNITAKLAVAASLALAATAPLAAKPGGGSTTPALAKYAADANAITVSGLSSGAYMANQLGTAYSATFKAVAMQAGGLYWCAEGNVNRATSTCMDQDNSFFPDPNYLNSVAYADDAASKGLIDSTSYLAGQNAYIFTGSNDTTVTTLVIDEVDKFYRHYGNAPAYSRDALAAGHGYPTLDYGVACSESTSPFINNCNFDGAGDILKNAYGALSSPSSTFSGKFHEFDQNEFLPDGSASSHSMAANGVAYVPSYCDTNAGCKVHVAIHGCKQNRDSIGDDFILNTGYNGWADANNIIVIYPQTIATRNSNPNACWDWWGYDDANYALKSGNQMVAIKGMVDRVISAK
jgi:poly(3-hydroxybutyrate) depolymerase